MIDPALFAELRDLCLRSFPERLDQRLSQIESIAAGRHPTLAFSLSWREGTRTRVERLLLQRHADKRTWWSIQDGQKAQREWVMLRWLYSVGRPVPRTYALGAQDPDTFLLLERPSGRPIALCTNGQAEEDREPDRQTPRYQSQAARPQHVDALATLLAQLHRLSAPDSVREILPWIDAKGQLEHIALIAQRQENADLIEAIRELSQDQVEAYPPCVLHGDPQLASLRCDARGITAWLDWENSAMGDPRWDVAHVMNQLQSSQKHSWADRFCEVYVERADVPLHDMAHWQALAAIQRWAIIRQTYPTVPQEDKSQLSVQLERNKKQTWLALAHLRDARAAAEQPE